MTSTCNFSPKYASTFAERIKNSESFDSYKERDDHYHDYINASQYSKIPVIRVTTDNGAKISLLIEMPASLVGNMGDISNISHEIACEWGCSVCVKRLHVLRNFIGSDGKAVFCRLEHASRTDLQKGLNQKCEKIISKFREKYDTDFRWDFHIVTKNTLYQPTDGAAKYQHYSYVPESVTTGISQYQKIWIPKALTKYTPLISALLSKIDSIGNTITCCSILSELLKKAAYGKSQVPAVDWFLNLLKKGAVFNDHWEWIPFNKRLSILADVICNSSIVEGDSQSAHIGFFHTINGFVIDIIENGKSPEGVVKMIEMRNAPENYRRKSGKVKEGHIKAAEKLCGNIVNTVETISEIESHPGCVKIQSKSPVATPATQTSKGAFAQMRDEEAINRKGSKKHNMEGFAARMTKNLPSKANTFSEIIADITSGKITKVEINTKGMETLYTAKTTLSPSDLAYGSLGHLWSFGGRVGVDKTPSAELVWKPMQIYGGYGYGAQITNWNNVTHIYPFNTIKHSTILFAIENSDEMSHMITGNCLFPEFLAPKHRAAEKAVERLNTMTRVAIPHDCSISYGVGTSVGFENGILTNPVTIRITSGSRNSMREIKITSI